MSVPKVGVPLSVARQIVNYKRYRTRRPAIQRITELKTIPGMTDELFDKVLLRYKSPGSSMITRRPKPVTKEELGESNVKKGKRTGTKKVSEIRKRKKNDRGKVRFKKHPPLVVRKTRFRTGKKYGIRRLNINKNYRRGKQIHGSKFANTDPISPVNKNDNSSSGTGEMDSFELNLISVSISKSGDKLIVAYKPGLPHALNLEPKIAPKRPPSATIQKSRSCTPRKLKCSPVHRYMVNDAISMTRKGSSKSRKSTKRCKNLTCNMEFHNVETSNVTEVAIEEPASQSVKESPRSRKRKQSESPALRPRHCKRYLVSPLLIRKSQDNMDNNGKSATPNIADTEQELIATKYNFDDETNEHQSQQRKEAMEHPVQDRERKKRWRSGESKKRELSGENKKRRRSGESKKRELSGERKKRRRSGESKKRELSGKRKKRELSGERKKRRRSGECRDRRRRRTSQSQERRRRRTSTLNNETSGRQHHIPVGRKTVRFRDDVKGGYFYVDQLVSSVERDRARQIKRATEESNSPVSVKRSRKEDLDGETHGYGQWACTIV